MYIQLLRLIFIICFLHFNDAFLPTTTKISSNSRIISTKLHFELKPLKPESQKNIIKSDISKLSDPDNNSNNIFNIDNIKEIWNLIVESELLWKAVILMLCLAWALQFSIIKQIYNSSELLDSSMYSAIRFSICGIIFSPAIFRAIQNQDLLIRGLLVGSTVFIGYVGQAGGLESASAGYAAFICSLATVWVAFLESISTGIFKNQTWFSVCFAVCGTAFLELQGGEMPDMNLESLYLLMMPIGFGTGYVALSNLIKRYPDDVEAVTGLKLGTSGLLCSLWAASNGHHLSEIPEIFANPIAGPGLIYTSVFTTAFAVWIQSKAFKRVSASDASIILSSEPVWAGAFAYYLLGEQLTSTDILGAAMIIFAGLSNELKFLERLGLERKEEVDLPRVDTDTE